MAFRLDVWPQQQMVGVFLGRNRRCGSSVPLPSPLSTEWAQREIPFLSPTEQSSRQLTPPIGVTIASDAGPNATVATTRTAPNRQTAMSATKTFHPLQKGCR